MSTRRLLVAAAVAVLPAGCAHAGTPVSATTASKLDVATSRISVACGYAEELTATGGGRARGLGAIEAIAVSGARKLSGVYLHDQTHIYQGESVGAIVGDSISLLAGCRLHAARAVLEHALHGRH